MWPNRDISPDINVDAADSSLPMPANPGSGMSTLLNASPETSMDDQSDPDPGSQALDDPYSESGADPTPAGRDVEAPQQVVAGGIDLDELSDLAQINDIKLSMQFIRALKRASLDDKMGLESETIECLQNALQLPIDIIDPDLRLSLDLFLSVSNSSQETYTTARKAILCCHPNDEILSYDQVKCRIAEPTGVVPLSFDMCINSCMGYTGPFSNLESCPYCDEPWYNAAKSGGKKLVPHQVFHTTPIGPQLQALW